MRRLALSVLPLVVGVVVAGSVAAPAQARSHDGDVTAKRPVKAAQFALSGTLTATTSSTVTLTVKGPRRDRGASVTVEVADTARIVLNHAPSTLAALPVGARVAVSGTATATTRTATRVKVETPDHADD